jgi:hypothetical protein
MTMRGRQWIEGNLQFRSEPNVSGSLLKYLVGVEKLKTQFEVRNPLLRHYSDTHFEIFSSMFPG